jgi:quercetin dioxygenase-like cupin family protein/catechol 2,3-dioxygenase-like lactoylglutathione lyase family enzyme
MTESPVTRTTILDQRLPLPREVGRVEVRRITIEPSAAGGAHMHNGPVVGAIESGSVVFQIGDAPATTLRAGDVFYEPADEIVSKFDATDEGVTFLGYFLLSVGQDAELAAPTSLPVSAPVAVPIPTPHLLHHVGVLARDFRASETFYTTALAPLGIEAGHRADGVAEYWITGHDTPSLSLEAAPSPAEATRGVHLAFGASSTTAVDAFHRAAVDAGGVSRHEPRHWPEYGAYAAFVSDPDGNNVEALVKDR